ncbi:MAG: Fur family transcriptional regulator [Bacteroidales bacterium]
MTNTDQLELRSRLKEKGLKVTPQRVAVYQALIRLNNHPTAENVADYVRNEHPNIATGTVYNILETFTDKELVKKVKTEKDVMRYDAMMENHHHIYCEDSEKIEDYFDNDLDELLYKYFKKKKIPGFNISEIRTQIVGKFQNNGN